MRSALAIALKDTWPVKYRHLSAVAKHTDRAAEYARNWQHTGAQPSVAPAGRLERLFDARTHGRGIWKWRHYFDFYERHCAKFVGRRTHLLEIGIYSGGSLDLWREYFGPECQITGIDIEPGVQAYASDGVRVLVGDQGDPAFWRSSLPTLPRIDVAIDDGGHHPYQQIVTLEALLPHMNPGGVYICEDIHHNTNAFNAYTAGLLAELNTFRHAPHPDAPLYAEPTAFQSAVKGIHCYPFAVVIELHDHPLRELIAPKRGTEWQPFYEAEHVRPSTVTSQPTLLPK